MAKSIFKVLQDGKIIEYQFYPYDLRYKVPQVGGSFYLDSTMDSDTFGNLKIMSTKEGVDISYTVASNNSWITINNKKITLAENTETVSRNGSITLVQSETDDTMDIFFVQEPKDEPPVSYVFTAEDGSVDYNLEEMFEPEATMAHIYLFSYTGDTPNNTVENVVVTMKPSWITSVDQVYDGEVGKVYFIANLSENTAINNRIDYITFMQVDSGKEVRIGIYQKAGSVIIPKVNVNYEFNVINNATKSGFLRFYLNLMDNTGRKLTSMFSILARDIKPGESITEKSVSTGYPSLTDGNYTASKAGITSSSGLKETYKIYCNNNLIINTTITTQTGQPIVSDLFGNVTLTAGNTYNFTGTITYSNP